MMPLSEASRTEALFTGVRGRGILRSLHTISCIENGASKPQGSLLANLRPMTDSYLLWCSVDMQDRECSTATLVRERSTHVSCLASRSPVSAVVSPTPCPYCWRWHGPPRRHPARVVA